MSELLGYALGLLLGVGFILLFLGIPVWAAMYLCERLGLEDPYEYPEGHGFSDELIGYGKLPPGTKRKDGKRL